MARSGYGVDCVRYRTIPRELYRYPENRRRPHRPVAVLGDFLVDGFRTTHGLRRHARRPTSCRRNLSPAARRCECLFPQPFLQTQVKGQKGRLKTDMRFQTTFQPFFGNHVEQFCTLVYIRFPVDVAMGSASRRRRIQLSGKNEGINPVFHFHGCFANLFLYDTHSLKSLIQRTIC